MTIIEGIRDWKGANEEGKVTIDSLYQYVYKQMQEEGFQKPMKWDLNVEGDLVIASSGKSNRAKRAEEIRIMLLDLSAKNILPDFILSKAILLISSKKEELSKEELLFDALLDKLLQKNLEINRFIEEWYKIASKQSTTPKELLEQRSESVSKQTQTFTSIQSSKEKNGPEQTVASINAPTYEEWLNMASKKLPNSTPKESSKFEQKRANSSEYVVPSTPIISPELKKELKQPSVQSQKSISLMPKRSVIIVGFIVLIVIFVAIIITVFNTHPVKITYSPSSAAPAQSLPTHAAQPSPPTPTITQSARTSSIAKELDVRGVVANLGIPQFTWTSANFDGFYYDIDEDIGAETMTFRLSDATPTTATLSDQPDLNGNRGIVYTTKPQAKNFKFKPWGQYWVMGFLAEKCFVAYDSTVTKGMKDEGGTIPYLYDKSKNNNLMTNKEISKVLIDDNVERTITSEAPLKLQEGYQLRIMSIDVDGNKVYLEMSNNGQVVDTKVVQPSITGAQIDDKTYYFKTTVGSTQDIIQIAVHFKNAFRGASTNIATVDGIFQISDTPQPIKEDQQYDKMSIENVNPADMTITMDNKDNQVTLGKNRDFVLMQNLHIKAADQDGTAAKPLRFGIYKAATIAATNVASSIA